MNKTMDVAEGSTGTGASDWLSWRYPGRQIEATSRMS